MEMNFQKQLLYFLKNIQRLRFRSGQAEEQHYYEKIFGMQGEFLFADTIQDARLKIITGQGYMPVDVINKKKEPDTTICQIPLYRNDHMIKKNYCAFWKRDNSGYYIEEFAQLLKSAFCF